jgi:uncharacterized membrane protein
LDASFAGALSFFFVTEAWSSFFIVGAGAARLTVLHPFIGAHTFRKLIP